MGVLKISSLFVFTCWVLSLRLEAHCDCPGISLKLLQVPHAMSNRNSATFAFESYFVTNGEPCTACSFTCKLDDGNFSECEDRKVTYGGLLDGKHSFKVCSNGSAGLDCACYNWTIDTVPPTASLTSSTSFTNALNFTVNVSFSEICSGGGGFRCSSVEGCNLLVYGAGQVVPSSLRILQPNLTYSLLVSLDSSSQFGRVILVMDKDFCNDRAGNRFMQTTSSILSVNYDRRSVLVKVTTQIPEQKLQFEGQERTVQATNDHDHLKIYLNFSQPILNSSADILNSLNISTGSLVPIPGNTQGNRSFGFMVVNESSGAVVTITINSNFILTGQGTAVSPMAPITFLYDTERPRVGLSTSLLRTREQNIPISIKFTKPVFGFNTSNIVISGGHLQSFQEHSQSIYSIQIEAESNIVSVYVPENVTADVAGNKNIASDSLQVRHYTIPNLSHVVSTAATAAFLATSFAAGLLSISTASLQSLGAFRKPSSFLTSDPSRNLFRMACHVQVFALSRWLAVVLPVEYYELARGIQWTIPYISLPWEAGHIRSIMAGSNPPSGSTTFITSTVSSETYASTQPNQDKLGRPPAPSVNSLPLNPREYRSFFESTNNKSEAQYIYDPQNANGWRDFGRNMFWLAVIGGGLMLLHALLLLILKSKKKNNENQNQRDYGALSFPRFEIFMLTLVLPCICQASANVIRGGTPSGIVVGILLLGLVSFALLTLLLFLSSGITYGKLVQYKEQVGRGHQWYDKLAHATLGPREGGQWTWKNQQNSNHLIMFGPLFEDLRGPPEYMISQTSGSNPCEGDRKDETAASFIQKLFSNLRIYYPLLESIKRVSLGIVAGAYSRNRSSRTPTITLLCITGFQLFFLVLKKPFIRKRVQLVEIISVSTEVGLFASCAVLPRRESSAKKETSIGNSMVMLFLAGFLAQMVNEWCALYLQTKRLGPNNKSFFSGLKVASRGLVSIFLPSSMIPGTETMYPPDQPEAKEPADTSSAVDRNRSSSSQSSGTNKPWLRDQRHLPKASTFPPSSMMHDTKSMLTTDQPEAREPADTSSSADRYRSSSIQSSGTDKPWLRQQRDLAEASIFISSGMIQDTEGMLQTDPPEAREPADTSFSADRSIQSPGTDKPWLRQQRDLAKASIFTPSSMMQDTESMLPTDPPEARELADTSSSADRNRGSSIQSSSTDKPWLRQQRDLAKASIFIPSGMIQNTESMPPTDPPEAREPADTRASIFVPSVMIQDTESMLPTDPPEAREPVDTSSSTDRNRSSSIQSSSTDKPWLRQQRDLAKASISIPSGMIQDTESMLPTDSPKAREPADTSSSTDRNRSSSIQSSGTDKPWLRQQRDLAEASIFISSGMIQDTKGMLQTDPPEAREPADTSFSADRNRSSSIQSLGTDKPWLRQQRDLAKASIYIPSGMIQDTESMLPTDPPEAREPADTSF